MNTFRPEQRKNFLKIDYCTAVKFDEFLLLCVCVTLLVFILLFLLCFFPKTQKDQKYFFTICLFWFLAFILLLLVCYKKIQKDFALFACFLLFLFPIQKHQKYLLFFFGFVIRGRWYLGKCWLKTNSGLIPKKFSKIVRTLFWEANFCACSPGCYLTFISLTLFELSSGRIS